MEATVLELVDSCTRFPPMTMHFPFLSSNHVARVNLPAYSQDSQQAWMTTVTNDDDGVRMVFIDSRSFSWLIRHASRWSSTAIMDINSTHCFHPRRLKIRQRFSYPCRPDRIFSDFYKTTKRVRYNTDAPGYGLYAADWVILDCLLPCSQHNRRAVSRILLKPLPVSRSLDQGLFMVIKSLSVYMALNCFCGLRNIISKRYRAATEVFVRTKWCLDACDLESSFRIIHPHSACTLQPYGPPDRIPM